MYSFLLLFLHSQKSHLSCGCFRSILCLLVFGVGLASRLHGCNAFWRLNFLLILRKVFGLLLLLLGVFFVLWGVFEHRLWYLNRHLRLLFNNYSLWFLLLFKLSFFGEKISKFLLDLLLRHCLRWTILFYRLYAWTHDLWRRMAAIHNQEVSIFSWRNRLPRHNLLLDLFQVLVYFLKKVCNWWAWLLLALSLCTRHLIRLEINKALLIFPLVRTHTDNICRLDLQIYSVSILLLFQFILEFLIFDWTVRVRNNVLAIS